MKTTKIRLDACIFITQETRNRIKRTAHKDQTYDDIINLLIDNWEKETKKK